MCKDMGPRETLWAGEKQGAATLLVPRRMHSDGAREQEVVSDAIGEYVCGMLSMHVVSRSAAVFLSGVCQDLR